MKLRQVFAAYVSLTKPRIVTMSLVTMAMGYCLGARGMADSARCVWALIGTGLAAAGASVLNQYLERDADGRMTRTRGRPLPRGIIEPENALLFGLYLTLGGMIMLLVYVNLITAFLVLLSAFLYVLVYTPMKKVSVLNTPLGAIPGALQPLAGWTAATGDVGVGGFVLFLILFVWQHPHFYAIAWMYRDDYRKAGFRMISETDDGARCGRWILVTCAALLPVSLMPVLLGMSHGVYFWTALVGGVCFLATTIPMARAHADRDARRVLKMSVYYLPILLLGIVVDTILWPSWHSM